MMFDPFEYVVSVIINRYVAGLGALPRDEDDEDDEDDDWLEDDDEL